VKLSAQNDRDRFAHSVIVFFVLFTASAVLIGHFQIGSPHLISDGEFLMRLFVAPVIGAALIFTFLGCGGVGIAKMGAQPTPPHQASPVGPFQAQVVGLQWLNPLQRRDYPTEWQLLWTMGIVKPNINDDMVKSDPDDFSSVKTVAAIAYGQNGTASFASYHSQYISDLANRFRDIYFSDSHYFYNAHSLKDKSSWRELAGVHVEYALPEGKLDPVIARDDTIKRIVSSFDIGNTSFPNSWTRSTPPDVRITMGGANAGFTSLAAGLDYLQSHPAETVWVMNWDAPSRPKDKQINENMVLLVLAGPDYKTGRAPLAWLPYPAVKKTADFTANQHGQSRQFNAWKATLDQAALNAGVPKQSLGFVIHDANNQPQHASDRVAILARTMREEVPGIDFMAHTFNTPALLGDMGAGTALTNVALAIAYANHFGKNVLVVGTNDQDQPTATVVLPPPVIRPIVPGANWFRARGGNHMYLPWWGLRHDAPAYPQGFSK
jgi:hypothetical protein